MSETDYNLLRHEEASKLRAQQGFESKPKPANNLNGTGAPKIRSVKDIPSIRTFGEQKMEFILEGRIAAATVTMVTGEPGSGKTTLVTSWCGAIANGEAWAGLAVQGRSVLILDRENTLPVVIERFNRLGLTDSENFRIWGSWCSSEPPEPCSPIVVEWVIATDPKPVIVVDSLAAFNGGDENDATQTRLYMDQFRRLANLGATLVVIHHSGKSDTSRDYRGSSDIKSSIDVGYKLTNLGEATRLTSLRLTAFKARFLVEPESIFHYNDGEFRLDSRPTVQTNEEILQALLIGNPGIGQVDFEKLAVEKGTRRSRARDFLANGIVNGSIRQETGPRNARFHHWVGRESGG